MSAVPPTVYDEQGRRGTLHESESASEGRIVVRFDGTRLEIPRALLHERSDGSYLLTVRVPDLPEREVLPIVEESLHVGKRQRGERIVISKTMNERRESIEVPLERDDVEIERVSVNRVVDIPPAIRTEGDTTIVPVVEERLVVEKRTILKEEVRITRRHTTDIYRDTVTLRSEEIDVRRTPRGEEDHVDVDEPVHD